MKATWACQPIAIFCNAKVARTHQTGYESRGLHLPFPARCRLGKGTAAAAAPCRLQDRFAGEHKSPLARCDVTRKASGKFATCWETHSFDMLRTTTNYG